MNTFIVHDYVWSTYQEAAATLGLVIHETEHQDEYKTLDPADDSFSETVSGELVLADYIYHCHRAAHGVESYCSKDALATFALLDERLKDDAAKFNLAPHVYLTVLEKLQSCLYDLEIDYEIIEDPMEWLESQSFLQLEQMYQSTLK